MNWIGSPELDAVLARARKKLESNGLRVEGDVTVSASPEIPELHMLCMAITGKTRVSFETEKITFPLKEIDRWVSNPRNYGKPLLALLDDHQPLVDKRSMRESDSSDRAAGRNTIEAVLHDDRHAIRRSSLLSTRNLLGHIRSGDALRAARILAVLPADGESITEIAQRATGDTKALTDTPTRLLVLRALAAELDVPAPDTPEQRRAIWDAFGVNVDALSSSVLVLGLTSKRNDPLGRMLTAFADVGEPLVLTLAQLTRWPLMADVDDLFVCENPAVVAAAVRRPEQLSHPLVCTRGQPSLATRTLLSQTCGTVHWRGDFDWTGLRTTAAAGQWCGAKPWRMGSATYRDGLGRGETEKFKSRDRPAPSPWDPALADAMHESGSAVMEERIIDLLLPDLF